MDRRDMETAHTRQWWDRAKTYCRDDIRQHLRILGELLARPIIRFLTDGGNQYAGNIAYLMFLAVFPFLIFLTTIAAFLQDSEAATRFVNLTLSSLPPVVSETLGPVFEDMARERSGSLLGLSILGTLWIAGSAIEALRSGLNKAYRVTQPRGFLYHRVQGLAFLILGAAAILVAMTFLVFLPTVVALLPFEAEMRHALDRILALGRYVAVPIVMIGLGVIVYRFLPNTDYGWRKVLPGSVLSFVIWLALIEAFAAYVRNFESFSLIYGGLGGVIALLLFLYFSAAAFLVGAEFNVVLADLSQRQLSR